MGKCGGGYGWVCKWLGGVNDSSELNEVTFIMADILNINLRASKLTFVASLGKEDCFELQTHEPGEKLRLIEMHIK